MRKRTQQRIIPLVPRDATDFWSVRTDQDDGQKGTEVRPLIRGFTFNGRVSQTPNEITEEELQRMKEERGGGRCGREDPMDDDGQKESPVFFGLDSLTSTHFVIAAVIAVILWNR